MVPKEILNLRLTGQILTNSKLKTPAEVVSHMGAIQAQDYLGSLWAVGLRTENATEQTIEQALTERTIVRTWPMRGTLHYIAPQDIRWMLRLLTPRIVKLNAKRVKREYDLDADVFLASRKILEKALQGEKQLLRNEVYRVLEEGGISTKGQRGLHIIGHLAQDAIICFGPRAGKQPTFVLLDEWIPKSKQFTQEESLAEIAQKYFKSRGPATLADFIWWTGLTTSAAQTAVELNKSRLQKISVGSKTYWMVLETDNSIVKNTNTLLLPPFDEYLVSYTDRSLMLGNYTMKDVVPYSNGMFFPIMIENGVLIGTWRRTIMKNSVNLEIKPYDKLNPKQINSIKEFSENYARFLGLKLQ